MRRNTVICCAALVGMALAVGCTAMVETAGTPVAGSQRPVPASTGTEEPGAAGASSGAPERASGMTYPATFPNEFTKYAVVDRPDASRSLFIDTAALQALTDDRPLPEGTILVITGHAAEGGAADPNLLHVAEKRSTWQPADVPSGIQVDAWNFAAYDARTRQRTDEDITACFNCHSLGGDGERMFSQGFVREYRRTTTVQTGRCDRPEREPCDR